MEGTNSDRFGIRIWGWPTLFLVFLFWSLFAVFKFTAPDNAEYLLEPESSREYLFESILGILFIGYLWILIYRCKKMKVSVSWFAKWGVITLTLLFSLGEICLFFRYVYDF